MNTPQNPSAQLSTVAFVHDLDDATLRSGHALLNMRRVHRLRRLARFPTQPAGEAISVIS